MSTTLQVNAFTFRYTSYAPGEYMAPHCDGATRVSIVLWGGVRETTVARDETATSASVVLKPGDLRHANRFGERGAGVLSVTRRRWPDWVSRNAYVWVHSGPAVAASTRLVGALTDGPAPLELESCAWALIDALDGHGGAPPGAPPEWLKRLHARLAADSAQPVSVRSMAREAAVHPVHLTRLFHRYYGRSVTAYVREQRVRAAADILASSDRSLSRVALDTGFSDQSHLCRVFKAERGVTPGQYRRIMAPNGFDSFNT